MKRLCLIRKQDLPIRIEGHDDAETFGPSLRWGFCQKDCLEVLWMNHCLSLVMVKSSLVIVAGTLGM
jgi:hypothetical protein